MTFNSRTTILAVLATVLVSISSIYAAPCQVFAMDPNGLVIELQARTEREIEPILESIPAAIRRGDIPVIRPDATFLINAEGLTPAHFTRDTGAPHDVFRFITASLVNTQREWGLDVVALPQGDPPTSWTVRVTTPPATIGELIVIARNGATVDEDVGYIAAVSETGTVENATALFPPSNRDRVNRVRADMRSMATALECYLIDWNRYPTASYHLGGKGLNANDPLMSQMPGPMNPVLTTPIAYITHYPADPFAATESGTHAYWNIETGHPLYDALGAWALMSPGPDGDWDLDLSVTTESEIRGFLLNTESDPNGDGDIIRSQRLYAH